MLSNPWNVFRSCLSCQRKPALADQLEAQDSTKTVSHRWWGMLLTFTILGLLAPGQPQYSHAAEPELGPRATVARFQKAPTVDGKIDTGEWDRALLTQPFMDHKGSRLDPRLAKAMVGFTEKRLYIAIVSGVPPLGPRARKQFRDATLIYDSVVELWLDPEPGNQNSPYYQLLGNSIGTIKDVQFDPQGGPDVGWNGNWDFENSVNKDEQRWVAELSIPWADFGWEGGAVGREIGLLVVRDFKRPWTQAVWMRMSSSFVNKDQYPRVALTEKPPVVRVESLGEKFFSGDIDLELRVVNPGPARRVDVQTLVTSTDMPQIVEEKTLDIAAGQEATHRFRVSGQRLHADARHTLNLKVTDAETDEVYFRHEGANWTQPSGPIWRGRDRNDPLRAVRIGYYPYLGLLKIRIDPEWLGKEVKLGAAAEISVTDTNGQEVTRETIRWEEPPVHRQIEVGELAEGNYNVTIDVAGHDEPFVRRFTRQYFPWENNTLGMTNKIYPPFEPMVVEDRTVRVVDRKYEKSGLGLWRGIEALGRELLAAPMVLRVNGESSLEGDGAFTARAGHEVRYEGQAEHPAVRVTTRTTTEYDGCMRVEMDLLPCNTPSRLESLSLDIPLKDGQMPLWHVSTTGTRNNPAGLTPEGTGRVWDTRDFPDGDWYGGFRPYIWLGAERRGLCWFADNDRGWVLDVDPKKGTYDPAYSLHRENGVLTLRVHFVQKPIMLETKRSIVFGLMATPAKPMPEDWRKIGRPDHRGLLFQMGGQYGLGATFNAKYPYNGDFGIFNAVQAGRMGARIDGQKVKHSWLDRNMWNVPETVREAFAKQVRRATRRAERWRGKKYLTVYFDEFHSTNVYHDEVPTFEAEWTGGWNHQNRPDKPEKPGAINGRIRTDSITDSYRDFATWYAAEWLRRGFGLYFDNSMPRRSGDLLTTSAYRLPTGRIQPSAGMWARRKYLKRIWVLHQQFRNEEAPPIMMIHMTNTHIVPYMVWNESNLDLEWLYGARPAQSKYPAGLLRAESMGLQTGNIPVVIAKTKKGRFTRKEKRKADRTRWGAMLVHEIKGKKRASVDQYPEPLVEFGYGLDGCEVYNYWDDNPPMTVSDKPCKWLLLKRDGELMVVLCTWNPKSEKVELSLEPNRLAVDVSQVVNAENGETIGKLGDGAFSIDMNGYGVRLFRIK